MKCSRTLSVLLVTITLVSSMNVETTSLRSTTQAIGNSNKNATSQVLESNASSINIFDVRTPPRVKEKLTSKHPIESSHAGVAIPIDNIEILEESTKKMNFYKIERPTTTNGGLSTWILLSGQSPSTTTKTTTKKPIVKPTYMNNEKLEEKLIASEKPMKIAKPIFKQRSTTSKPVTIETTKTTTVRINTFSPTPKNTTKKPAKLTRVKASLLNNSLNKSTSNNSTPIMNKNQSTINTSISSTTTSKPRDETTVSSKVKLTSTTEYIPVTIKTKTSTTLKAEAKEGEQELPAHEEKKKKTQKRKKNKNKRRKPEKSSKEDINNKLKEIDSPGTQLYSYLKSEIIPVTVGVSLVGLLVTAGLASYYLQPFAALRRSDPIDRKDTDGGYYYHDEYSNAMPEEEAIGKVIAGMPDNTLQSNAPNSANQPSNGNNYKQATSRNTYPQNVRYRNIDRRSQIYMNPYGSVENVKINEKDRAEVSYEQSTNNNKENKFVVGSIPKEVVQEVTPAVVPEHGPRNLKVDEQKFVVGNVPQGFFTIGASPRNLKIRRRKRRQVVPDDSENEIIPSENEIDAHGYKQILTTSSTERLNISTVKESQDPNNTVTLTDEPAEETTPHNVWSPSERPNSLFELITDLFRLKMRLGLELIQNVTNSVATYVSKVQTRLGDHYKHNNSKRNASRPNS